MLLKGFTSLESADKLSYYYSEDWVCNSFCILLVTFVWFLGEKFEKNGDVDSHLHTDSLYMHVSFFCYLRFLTEAGLTM